MKDWGPGDDPWTEHAIFSERCKYLRTVKGDDFIKMEKVKHAMCLGIVENTDQSSLDDEEEKEEVKEIEEKDERLCKICLNASISTVFLNCFHAVACGKCSMSISDNCPVCRHPILSVERLYFV